MYTNNERLSFVMAILCYPFVQNLQAIYSHLAIVGVSVCVCDVKNMRKSDAKSLDSIQDIRLPQYDTMLPFWILRNTHWIEQLYFVLLPILRFLFISTSFSKFSQSRFIIKSNNFRAVLRVSSFFSLVFCCYFLIPMKIHRSITLKMCV